MLKNINVEPIVDGDFEELKIDEIDVNEDLTYKLRDNL
jgi:hypothetical protein